MTLSTHVLDTVDGVPAEGVALTLRMGNIVLYSGTTNDGGRCPDLKSALRGKGLYSLTFSVASYFRSRGVTLPEPPFLDSVTIDFGVADGDAHYHVPLLVSPFSYSTYRGS